jgi:hypothetical protein
MRIFLAATLVLGLVTVLPASSQQPQTNPGAQAPAEAAKSSPNSAESNPERTQRLSSLGRVIMPALRSSLPYFWTVKRSIASLMADGFQSKPSRVNTSFSQAPKMSRRQ